MARVNHDIEHDSAGGEGRDRAGHSRPDRPAGEDVLGFSFPLLRAGWLRVRVHWIVPVYAACELLACLTNPKLGVGFGSIMIGSLIVLAVAREVVRALLARRLGSRVNVVTIWPLGGLDAAARPGTAGSAMAELGGLLFGAAMGGALAVALWRTGSSHAELLFNPFRPEEVFSKNWPLWRALLWSAYYANVVLLGLNLLLPMFPFDLGRVVAAGMRTNERVGRIGMFCAAALALGAATEGETRLIAVAGFGFLASFIASRRAQVLPSNNPEERQGTDEQALGADGTTGAGVLVPESELDRVLEKISREGLASLTVDERDVLSRETERRRGG